MKVICPECDLRWKDENTSTCEYCGKEVCFQCMEKHMEKCKEYYENEE